MCTPLAIAGLALSAGSAVANSAAASQVQKAREDAMEAERIRQAQFDRRAQAINTRSQDRYQDFGGKQSKRSAKLSEYFQGGAKGRATGADKVNRGGVLPPSSSNITVSAEKNAMGEAAQYADQQADALGDVRAFGDVLGGIGREQAQDASLIGQIGDFKRGSSSILPYELEDANQEGGDLRLVGDLFRGFGSLALSRRTPFEPSRAGGHSLGGGLGAAKSAEAGSNAGVAPRPLPGPVSPAPPKTHSAATPAGVSSLYQGVPQGGMATGPVPSLSLPNLWSLYSTPRGIW